MPGLTEELTKQEISYCFVHALAAQSRIKFDIPRVDDDSVDVKISYTGNNDGWIVASPEIDIQLKATSSVKFDKEGNIKFRLPIKNYRDLSKRTQVQRILIVLVLNNKKDHVSLFENKLLIDGSAYWLSLSNHTPPPKSAKSVTLTIPPTNKLTIESFMRMMENVGTDVDITSGLL